jgi:catechol 2,3-dioxygenase-like lactoylglutathione lyase family enzyme
MEGFVAEKLAQFDAGRISRRKLIEALTLAATASAAQSANAAGPVSVKAAAVNHVSYTCPNFREAADWYSKVFNLDQVGVKDTEATLPFGKMGEQPYGIAAKDVPLTFLIVRTRDLNAPLADGTVRPKAANLIDHMAYTVADFDRERAKADLKAMGVENVRDGGLYSLHMTDPFGYDVQISGLANNAISDGA